MTPSPGRIHQLPIKIHYSLEGGNQSYLTVLEGKQDVFVHPGQTTYGTDDEPGPIGSTYLKSIAQGVCYASPECVPSSSSLDFSVYNLDPSPRTRPHSQPFASSSTAPTPISGDDQSWSGKGFLSWAMAEPSNGSTLVKGRLMKEYDFEPSRISQEGGLEALMRAGNGGDGRGWGLEVVISLKLVNPGGKGEFSGRREFERMLFSGNGQASGSVLVPSPARPSPSISNVRPTPPPSQTHPQAQAQAQAQAPIYASGPAQNRTIQQGQMQNGAGGSNGRTPPVTAAPRAMTGNPNVGLGRPPLPASRSSISSLPPSSIPMGQTSSQSGPSRPPSAMADGRQPYRPPPPQQHSSSNSTASIQRQPNLPPHPSSSASNHPPSDHASSSNHPSSTSNRSTTPKKQTNLPPPKPMSRNSRQVTPPPLPRPKSPPPTTPHRRALRDLLQADGKMSPSLAKELVNNPSLMALLKSIPSTGAQQRTDQYGAGGPGGLGEHTRGNKGDDGRSVRDETPTPTGPKTTAGGVGIPGGCSNCGTTETSLWRSKVYPDGTQTKVCDDCGVYFNKNKRMRPKELWPTTSHGEPSSSKRAKTNSAHPTPPPQSGGNGIPTGVRHSPRLSKTGNTNATASSSTHPHTQGPQVSPTRSAPSLPAAQESPSKRRRSKPVPQPSPRMATRSSARTDTDEGGSGHQMDPFPTFSSPHSQSQQHSHSQSQSQAQDQGQGQGGGGGTGGGMQGIEDIDIEALLAQLTNGQPPSGAGDGLPDGGINLEDLFASVDNAAATDDALAEDMMKFLAGLENDIVESPANGNGNGDENGTTRGEGKGSAGPSTGA